MRLWLLDILACPTDGCKYYPLKLSIFEWDDNDAGRILEVSEAYAKGNAEKARQELKDSVKVDRVKGLVEDELVRSPMEVKDYALAFKEKVNSVFSNVVIDETGASTKLIKSILSFEPPSVLNESFENTIYVANWLAFKVNVKSGILVCEKCGRFYPIIDTIPHMLPDGLRDKKEDKEFLLKWQKFIPKKILEAEGIK
ncbi:MAG: Trm112 family protein [Candidatus Jordarchaeales archaeon]